MRRVELYSFTSARAGDTVVSQAHHVEWEPQPDLVRANTIIVDGQVKVELEVETWKKIDPVDFEPGGKYHILVTNSWEHGKKIKKRDLSKGIKKKKRQRGSNNYEASSSAAPGV